MQREYVGIDFHRRRSVVVQVGASGERLSVSRIDNTPAAVGAAGDHPEVVIEATPTAGTGQSTCYRSWARLCIWRTQTP